MSLKGDKYETVEEVKQRLEGTVVMYDGAPVYVKACTPPAEEDILDVARVSILPIPFTGATRAARKLLSARRFDLAPVQLGYMNTPDGVLLLSRESARQYKQGLSAGSLITRSIEGRRDVDPFIHTVNTPGFAAMVKGVYPSYEEASELLRVGAREAVAISRDFALRYDKNLGLGFLFHRGTACGYCLIQNASVVLGPNYSFLREQLEEAGVTTTLQP